MSVITTTYTTDKQLSKNFKLSEFLCKDGTKTVKYSTDLVALLQKLIDMSGLVEYGAITSGYRTSDYSVKVGGEKDDAHTVGIAVDIQFKDKSKNIIPQKYIACLAQDLGFGGIGIMKNSIHLDVRHLGGERVFYDNGRLMVLTVKKVIDCGKSKPYPEKTVCKNFVFVVGDNRDFSFDSRQGALIPIRDIVGVFIYRAERSNKRKKKLNENRKRRVIPVVFHGSFLSLIKDVWDNPEIATGFLNSLNHKNFKKYK